MKTTKFLALLKEILRLVLAFFAGSFAGCINCEHFL